MRQRLHSKRVDYSEAWGCHGRPIARTRNGCDSNRNEEAAIVDTIRSFQTTVWGKKLGFLVVDGNSTDRTRELAEQEGAWVVLEPRKGYGRAYRTGFALAPW
ncbi:MAG: hypothetical protein Ct9H90mP16_07580 [Candidatus Poseidoniales archaeon]|nr:MAG: hypothetical protein Ct9H90mP16_07580 [Candidatus Poseidoniales archaeon]